MLHVAEFSKAILAGAPVRVMIQLRYECRPFGSAALNIACWFWTF